MGKPISTKFVSQLIVAGILCFVFLVLAIKGMLSDTMFIAWLAGMLANFGIYATSNVASKKYRPPNGGSDA